MRYLLIALLLLSPGLFAAVDKPREMPPLHHVVKVKPPKGMTLPDDFPLNDKGEIDCQTCHGLKDIDKTPLDKVDKNAANFHRGGPYPSLTDFCYRCHEKKAYQRPNIHKLLDDQGKYDKKACEYCHQEAPDPSKKVEREKLKFRLPPQKLCYGCHLKTPHLNALNHLREPDKKMRKRIQRAEEKLAVILPLDTEGKIMCATCHTPHPRGLIEETKPAGRQVSGGNLDDGVTYEDHPWDAIYAADKEARLKKLAESGGRRHALHYQRLKTEVLLRLPARDGTLCLACHEFEK